MAPRPKDIRCRQDVLFSMDLAVSVFTPRSYSIVARNKVFKTLVVALAKEQPDVMRPFLRKTLHDMPSSATYHENIVGGKRCAENMENSREAKKAKLEKTRSFVERTFPCERDGKDSLFIASDDEEQSDSDEGAGDCKMTYTPYEIEFGLTHGTRHIHSMFVTKFATIPHSDSKDGSRIFDICEQFKFDQVSASLIKFFRTPTKTSAIPLACKTHKPSQILCILRKIDRFVQEPKIYRAFAQIMLFTTIDAKVKERHSDHIKVIDELAMEDVGSEFSEVLTAKVTEYRTDYHWGRKWLELSEYYGGTAIVFIITVIRFGPWKFFHEWNDFERSCFGIVASHLLSIRSMVECLGDSALENYCTHGSLPEQKIIELEELKGLVPDDDGSNSESGEE